MGTFSIGISSAFPIDSLILSQIISAQIKFKITPQRVKCLQAS
jgi:hypothetical protein